MELKQIAKNLNERLADIDSHYIGPDNIWGLALAFCTGGEESKYEALVNHPQYQDGEALFALWEEAYEEWFALMEKHDMWPVVESSIPENFVFELPEKLH